MFASTPAARHARPRDGVRAVDLRRLERGRLHLGRAARRRTARSSARWSSASLIITVLYVAVNVALLMGLGLSRPSAQSKAAPADLVARAFGAWRGGSAQRRGRDRRADLDQRDDARRRAHQLRAGRDWPALRFLGGWNAHRGVPTAALPRAGCDRARARRVRRRSEGRLRGDGRVHRAGILGLPRAGRHRAFRAARGATARCARARSACRSTRSRRRSSSRCAPTFCYSSIMYATSRSAIHVTPGGDGRGRGRVVRDALAAGPALR